MSVPQKTPCPTQKGCKLGYLVLHRKRLEPRVLPWQQYSRCHFVSFVMYISGVKFEDHCSNISGDILNSVFYGFIHFFCLCPLGLTIKLNFKISKVAYYSACVVYTKTIIHLSVGENGRYLTRRFAAWQISTTIHLHFGE